MHTPKSFTNSFQGIDSKDVWKSYIEDLEKLPVEIKVLGINDYFTIDGYKKVLEYKKQGRLPNIELILPVIELRIAAFGGNSQFKRINYHIIFSNEVLVEDIEKQFLFQLSAKYNLSKGDVDDEISSNLDVKSVEAFGKKIIDSVPENQRAQYKSPLVEGYNNLNFDVKQILDILRRHPSAFKGRYLTAVGKTEWDDYKWNDNSIAEKKSIINGVHFVFTASADSNSFENAKNKLRDSNVNSRLLDCSDAHHNSWAKDKEKDKIGNCHNWIKAELTFEGLKQVVYEYDSRVCVQDYNPDMKAPYQKIANIDIKIPSVWNQSIAFNSNLNAIIGGRSTGKSTLLSTIAYKLAPSSNSDVNSFVKELSKGMKILWCDGKEESREIQYFGQNELYEIAKSESKRRDLVFNILNEKGMSKVISEYNTHVTELKDKLNSLIGQFVKHKDRYTALSQELKLNGNKKIHEDEILRLSKRIAELQTDSGMSETELKEYSENTKLYDVNVERIRRIEKNLSSLRSIEQIAPLSLNNEITSILTVIEDNVSSEINKIVSELQFEAVQKWKVSIQKIGTELMSQKEQVSLEVQRWKASDLYKKGMLFSERNSELKTLLSKIELENKEVNTVKMLEEEYKNIEQLYSSTLNNIISSHCSFWDLVNSMASNLIVNYENIAIRADIIFLDKELTTNIQDVFSMRSSLSKDFVDNFVKNYSKENKEDWLRKIIEQCVTQTELSFKGAWDCETALKKYWQINGILILLKLHTMGQIFPKCLQEKNRL